MSFPKLTRAHLRSIIAGCDRDDIENQPWMLTYHTAEREPSRDSVENKAKRKIQRRFLEYWKRRDLRFTRNADGSCGMVWQLRKGAPKAVAPPSFLFQVYTGHNTLHISTTPVPRAFIGDVRTKLAEEMRAWCFAGEARMDEVFIVNVIAAALPQFANQDLGDCSYALGEAEEEEGEEDADKGFGGGGDGGGGGGHADVH